MTTSSTAYQEERLARLAASLTQVPAEELRSQSLHMRLCEDARYKEECDELRKHAETMCAALNQQTTG